MPASHDNYVLLNRSRDTSGSIVLGNDDEGNVTYTQLFDDGGGLFRRYAVRRIRGDDGDSYAYFGNSPADVLPTFSSSELRPGDKTTVADLRSAIGTGPSPDVKKSLEQFIAAKNVSFEGYVNSIYTPWRISGGIATYEPSKQTKFPNYVGETEWWETAVPMAFAAFAGAGLTGVLPGTTSVFSGGLQVTAAEGFLGETLVAESIASEAATFAAESVITETVVAETASFATESSITELVADVGVESLETVVSDVGGSMFDDWGMETIFEVDSGYGVNDFGGYADDLFSTGPSDPTYYADSWEVFPDQVDTLPFEADTPYVGEGVEDTQIQGKPYSPTDPYDVSLGGDILEIEGTGLDVAKPTIPGVDAGSSANPFTKAATDAATKAATSSAVSAVTGGGGSAPKGSVSGASASQVPKLSDIFGRVGEYAKVASTAAREAQMIQAKLTAATNKANTRIALKDGQSQPINPVLIVAALGAIAVLG